MKIEPGQMCLSCGDNPATVAKGTVPLCSECAGKASGKGRGVTVKARPPKPGLVKCAD